MTWYWNKWNHLQRTIDYTKDILTSVDVSIGGKQLKTSSKYLTLALVNTYLLFVCLFVDGFLGGGGGGFFFM